MVIFTVPILNQKAQVPYKNNMWVLSVVCCLNSMGIFSVYGLFFVHCDYGLFVTCSLFLICVYSQSDCCLTCFFVLFSFSVWLFFIICFLTVTGAAVGVPLSQEEAQLCMVNDMTDLSPLAIAYARARGQ